jgi:hypothetical protein
MSLYISDVTREGSEALAALERILNCIELIKL